ncbi:MAG TPA: peptidoglycan-binding protein [Longimicrobium sp.]|nr:peptidoglycan-binding protein [Longimicrobium sp.]
MSPLLVAGLSVTAAAAQQGRTVLPEGSVIIVRTTTALESNTARVGQTFETVVADSISADEYTVIPAGSRIRGVVTFAQPADRQRSGVIEVSFDRLTLPGGAVQTLAGKLTSTDAAERRQIETNPNTRVVLVGGRGGVGGAIAGAGSENSPTSGILAALGSLLSQARDVRVAAGTPLAVQLEQPLVLSRRGTRRAPGGFTLYTAADRISAAQQALARQNYYRGAVSGQLDDATQRALFEFQVDKGITATGNLDWRTAQALGITANASGEGGTGTGGAVLTADEASQLRRGAQALAGRYRQEISLSATGRRSSNAAGEMELWFALSAFADNSSLYEQLVRAQQGNVASAEAAGRALISAARRVDAALQGARPSQTVQGAWSSIRTQLADLDSGYRQQY